MAELTVDMTYGNALFRAAEDMNKIEIIEEEALEIVKIFEGEPIFFQLINDPVISAAEKKDVLKKVFEGKVEKELLNFLYILVDKSRTRHYPKIVKAYITLKNEQEGFALGTIYSVNLLSEDQINKIESETENLIRAKVKLENKVDKSLIGGIKILVDGRMIDASLKKRLEDLGKELNLA